MGTEARRKWFLNWVMAAIVVVAGCAGFAAAGAAAASATQLATPDATLTYPSAGQQNVDAINPFRWMGVPGAQGYALAVGTHRWGTELLRSAVLPASQTSFMLAALPTGKTLYATLLTLHAGTWGSTEVTFAAARGDAFTYPFDGQSNLDVSKPITWSTVAASQGAIVVLGMTKFTANVYNSGLLPPSQNSLTLPPGLTGNVYATLMTKTNGVYTRFQEISFSLAPARVTIVNNYPLAIRMSLDGQNFMLAPGQKVGPVYVFPPAAGNDNTNIAVASDPGCGVGDDYNFFESGRSYTFTVVAHGGTCASGNQAPNFVITPA